ncbi:MAG: hypothetical protein IMY84_03200, partial [Chloroflexi bacterium]|nr:hypothetical protein [Chloroflexota bacterium]
MRAARFLRKCVGQFVALGSVYLYEYALLPRERASFLPRLDEYELRMVRSNDEADRLVRDGYEDFRSL